MGDIASDYSEEAASRLTTSDWWFKDPTDPTLNFQANIMNEDFVMPRTRSKATFGPIGRRYNVVVSDVTRGIAPPVRVDFLDADDHVKFETMFDNQRTVLLQSDMQGKHWYVQIEDWSDAVHNTVDEYRTVDVQLVEVDVPD
jgi:hypothetical protein